MVFTSTKFGNSNTINVPLEEVTNYTDTKKTATFAFIIAFAFFAVLGISFLLGDYDEETIETSIFLIFISVGSLIAYFATSENVWRIKLENYSYITFFKRSSDEQAVKDFIQELFEHRKAYIRETYLILSKNIDFEPQFRNLQWLKLQDAITDAEFLEYKSELEKLFNKEKPQIGFYKG